MNQGIFPSTSSAAGRAPLLQATSTSSLPAGTAWGLVLRHDESCQWGLSSTEGDSLSYSPESGSMEEPGNDYGAYGGAWAVERLQKPCWSLGSSNHIIYTGLCLNLPLQSCSWKTVYLKGRGYINLWGWKSDWAEPGLWAEICMPSNSQHCLPVCYMAGMEAVRGWKICQLCPALVWALCDCRDHRVRWCSMEIYVSRCWCLQETELFWMQMLGGSLWRFLHRTETWYFWGFWGFSGFVKKEKEEFSLPHGSPSQTTRAAEESELNIHAKHNVHLPASETGGAGSQTQQLSSLASSDSTLLLQKPWDIVKPRSLKLFTKCTGRHQSN